MNCLSMSCRFRQEMYSDDYDRLTAYKNVNLRGGLFQDEQNFITQSNLTVFGQKNKIFIFFFLRKP